METKIDDPTKKVDDVNILTKDDLLKKGLINNDNQLEKKIISPDQITELDNLFKNQSPADPAKPINSDQQKIETRGRKKGSKNLNNNSIDVIYDFDTTGFIELCFELVADLRGDHWRLSEGCLKSYAKSTNQVFNLYLKDVKYIALYLWVFETLIIVGKGLKGDKDKRALAKSNNETK